MIAFTLTLALALTNQNTDDPKSDVTAVTAALEGSYRFVSGEEDGRVIPAERLKDHRVRITRETFVVVDADQKDIYTAKYRLNVEKKPYGLAMTTTGTPTGTDGTTATGILDVQGDVVRLIYAPKGGVEPTRLKTEPNTKQNLFVLEKIRD